MGTTLAVPPNLSNIWSQICVPPWGAGWELLLQYPQISQIFGPRSASPPGGRAVISLAPIRSHPWTNKTLHHHYRITAPLTLYRPGQGLKQTHTWGTNKPRWRRGCTIASYVPQTLFFWRNPRVCIIILRALWNCLFTVICKVCKLKARNQGGVHLSNSV